jgi:MOSC domain-containing protein YiiM
MHLISVNIGEARSIQTSKEISTTGIYKLPSAQPVQVGKYGLEGDVIADKRHHGGVDQAIYIYGVNDYDWWSTFLNDSLTPGTFGENLTISDLESATVKVGDRFLVGEVVLEASAPRIPCSTLAARMESSQFVKQFRQAERPGIYCRVIQTGMIQSGHEVQFERYSGDTVTILEMFRDYYASTHSIAELRRYLAAPIDIRSRLEKEKELQAAQAGGEK